MPTRIISRREGGIVPEPVGRPPMQRGCQFILCHHTGPGTRPPFPDRTDAQHFAALYSSGVANGKPYEYNYVITEPGGWIWEWGGEFRSAHCSDANEWSYGIQMNRAADSGPPSANATESFIWLVHHLVATGQCAPVALDAFHRAPHYRLQSTQCSAPDCAQFAIAPWNSPTTRGSTGSLIASLLAPLILPFPPGDDVTEAEALLVAGRAWGDTTAVPTAATVATARAAALAKVAETLIPNFDGKPSQWRNYVVATNKNADEAVEAVAALDGKVQGIIDALTTPSTPEVAALIAALRPVIADEVRKALAATSLTVPAE